MQLVLGFSLIPAQQPEQVEDVVDMGYDTVRSCWVLARHLR